MSTYDDLKAKGIDMSWYDRAKGKQGQLNPYNTPLHDKACGRLSIYFYKANGELWTLDGTTPYALVRTGKQQPKDMYICACCKESFSDLKAAHEHWSNNANR